MSRPSKYSAELWGRLLAAVREDGRGLTAVCDAYEWAPDYGTVWRWLQKRPELRLELDAARADGAYRVHEKALHAVDTCRKEIKSMDSRLAGAYVQATRNFADVCLRSASALNRRLSEKHAHLLEGPDGGPLQVELVSFANQTTRAPAKGKGNAAK